MNKELLQFRLALLQVNKLSRILMGRVDELNYYSSFYPDLKSFYDSPEFQALYHNITMDYNRLGEFCRLVKLPKEEEFGNSGDDQDE